MSKCMRVGWLVCGGVMSSCVNRDNGVSFTCLVYCTLSKVSILSSADHYYTVLTPCFLFNNIVVRVGRVGPRVFIHASIVLSSACQVHIKCVSVHVKCVSSACQVYIKCMSTCVNKMSVRRWNQMSVYYPCTSRLPDTCQLDSVSYIPCGRLFGRLALI